MKILTGINMPFREIIGTWRKLRTHWIVEISSRFVLVLFVLSLAGIVWRWSMLPPVIPLWFSRPWGEERLAESKWIFLLPTASIVWHWITVVAATYFTHDYPVFTRVLFLTALLVAFLSFVATLKILFLVT